MPKDQIYSPRELKGLAILSKGDMIEMQWEDNYMVESQGGNGKYWVHKYRKRWKCSCPDFGKRKMVESNSKISGI